MFELADLLVGIYKTQDVSKSVAITPSSFVEPVKAAKVTPAGGALRPVENRTEGGTTGGTTDRKRKQSGGHNEKVQQSAQRSAPRGERSARSVRSDKENLVTR